MDVREEINTVIEKRSTMTIIYDGGSVPGAARAIAPISIHDDILVARCIETNTRKTFKLSKTRLAGPDPIEPYPQRVAESNVLQSRTFSEWVSIVLTDISFELSSGKWHIDQGDDHFSIHDFTRYGKPRKAAIVSISFHPIWNVTEYDMDIDRTVTITKPSLRPWAVSGVSYNKLGNAFIAFIKQYQALRK
jgi:hypothetical protein